MDHGDGSMLIGLNACMVLQSITILFPLRSPTYISVVARTTLLYDGPTFLATFLEVKYLSTLPFKKDRRMESQDLGTEALIPWRRSPRHGICHVKRCWKSEAYYINTHVGGEAIRLEAIAIRSYSDR